MRTSKKKAEIRSVALYARVSTVEQAERDLSIPAQIAALREYSIGKGYSIAAEYVEPGASGTDDNRKIFKGMMGDVLAPSSAIDAILVFHTSRFMRHAGKARAMKDVLRRRGIRVIAIKQEFDDDPMGQFVEGIFELVDQYESDVNGMRTSAALRENAKRGHFNGSQPPFGFKVEKTEERPGVARGRLVPDSTEVDLNREVFRLYVGGSGAKCVARELNQRGLRYRKGKLWTKDLVLKVVEESAVIGTYYWGKRDPRTGRLNDRDDWIGIPVEPILDAELFEMAQRVRAQRDPQGNPGRASSSPLLLAGLLRCGKCNASYQLETSGKLRPNGESYRYLNCRNFVRVGKEACDGFRISTEVVDKAVLEHVANIVFSEERCRTLLRDLVEESGLLRLKTLEQRKGMEAEVAELDRRIARWHEAFESGDMPRDLGTDRVNDLKAKRDEIVATLAKIVPLRPPPGYLYSEPAIKRFQAQVQEVFRSGDNGLTRNYLRFLLDEIVVDGKELRIFAKSDAALQMMASGGGEAPALNSAGEVRTTVVGWLRLLDSNQRPQH